MQLKAAIVSVWAAPFKGQLLCAENINMTARGYQGMYFVVSDRVNVRRRSRLGGLSARKRHGSVSVRQNTKEGNMRLNSMYFLEKSTKCAELEQPVEEAPSSLLYHQLSLCTFWILGSN